VGLRCQQLVKDLNAALKQKEKHHPHRRGGAGGAVTVQQQQQQEESESEDSDNLLAFNHHQGGVSPSEVARVFALGLLPHELQAVRAARKVLKAYVSTAAGGGGGGEQQRLLLETPFAWKSCGEFNPNSNGK
jgi:hypothetical protein